MVIDIEDDDDDDDDDRYDDNGDDDEEEDEVVKNSDGEGQDELEENMQFSPPESSFMTDGRGRVVWSGSSGPSGTQDRTHVPPRPKQPEGEGFMTDGRGRVIGTSEQAEKTTEAKDGDSNGFERQPESVSGRRSLLERMFSAIFPL
jgi:hypothetical protein